MPKRICPRCGSKKTAKILYGMPAMSPELEEHLNMVDVVLGGCCITDCDPMYHSNKCKKDFGAPTAELENEATSFYFSIGGFFGGSQMIMVLKMEDGAVVHYTFGPGFSDTEPTAKEQLSPEEWKAFIHSIFHCYITDWKKRYVDQHIVDGTQWELEVRFLNRKPIKIYGSNKYPVYWDKFIRTVKTLGFYIAE
ncbi:hypothetical protein JCM15765_21590 [Paradesulfitobacterium aromaticivorans]